LIFQKKIVEYSQSSEFDKKFSDFSGYSDFSHPPLINSGDKVTKSFEDGFITNRKVLKLNTIVVYLSARYQYQFSTMARTIFINPTESKENTYKFSLELLEYITQTLMKPGNTLKYVAEQAIAFVEERNPDLSEKLVKNFGSSAGFIFNDKKTQINLINEMKIQTDTCFVVSVCFEKLFANDAKHSMKNYSILIADTIHITSNGNQILTTNKKDMPYVKMVVTNDSDASEDEDQSDNTNKKFNGVDLENVSFQNLVRKKNDENNAFQNQSIFRKKLYENSYEKLMKMDPIGEVDDVKAFVQSYPKFSAMPSASVIKSREIYVDSAKKTVIFSIFGQSYPIHISKLKNINISNSVDGDFSNLRINLICPMSLYKANDEQMSCYIKELHYKANDFKTGDQMSIPSTYLKTVANEIKELQKSARKSVNENINEVIELKNEKPLNFEDGRRIQLHNVFFRNSNANKRISGSLEAYSNVFVYTKKTGDRFVLPFSEIEYSIYLPCTDDNNVIALHFRLKSPIMLNNKKTEDIQFFVQIREEISNLNEPRSKMGKYYDEYHEEEISEQMKKKLRASFITFCKEVEDRIPLINFHRPLSDFYIEGRNNLCMKMLFSDSLMFSIVEWPALIVDVKKVELVYFERDDSSLHTFDIAIIMKDYSKKVLNIQGIIRDKYTKLQNWLSMKEIPYFTGIQVLNWPRIMRTVLEDPHGFAENGNWNFLSNESSDEEDSEKTGSEATGTSNDDEEDDDDDNDDESSESEESIPSDEMDSDEDEGEDFSTDGS